MYATSSRFDCPPFPFRNLVLIRKIFLFKKISLISFQKQTQSRKTADPKIGVPMLASLATHLFSLEQRGECDPVQPSNG